MRSVPLRVSCFGLVRCLACFWGGGGGRSRSPRAWLGVLCPLAGGPVPPGPSGAGEGGGGGLCAGPTRGHGWGAPRGGRSLYLGPPLCLPWAGTKAGVIGVAQFLDLVASILLWFVFVC